MYGATGNHCWLIGAPNKKGGGEGNGCATGPGNANGCWLISAESNAEGKWEGPGCDTAGNSWLFGGY